MVIVLAIVLTLHWQLVANIGTHFVGRPFDDAIAVMWEFSWARDALARGDLSLLAEDVYFPYGYHTASDAQPIWWAFLAAPLVSITSVLVAYNTTLLVTLASAGIGTYLLVHELTGDRRAGVFSAIVYCSAPVITLRLAGHLNLLLGAQWLPYMVWAARRACASHGRRSGLYSVAAGVMFAMMSLSSWYFVFIGFVPLASSYLLSVERWSLIGQRLPKMLLSLGVWLVVVTPFLLATIGANQLMFAETTTFAPLDSDVYSLSPDRLLSPNPSHSVWGDLSRRAIPVSGEQDVVSLGYAALVMGFLGYIHSGKRRMLPYVGMGLVAIAMGTTLHWNGQQVLIGLPDGVAHKLWMLKPVDQAMGRFVVPMPGLFLAKYVPFYAAMRAWSRYTIVTVLALAVLAGFGAKYLLLRGRLFWTWITLLFVLLEGLMTPYREWTPISAVTRSVDVWLSEQTEHSAVIEYPWLAQSKPALLGQTVHGQPIVNGYAPHMPKHLVEHPEVTRAMPNEAAVSTLRDWRVRFVLVAGLDSQEYFENDLTGTVSLPGLCWVGHFPNDCAATSVYVFEIVSPEAECSGSEAGLEMPDICCSKTRYVR